MRRIHEGWGIGSLMWLARVLRPYNLSYTSEKENRAIDIGFAMARYIRRLAAGVSRPSCENLLSCTYLAEGTPTFCFAFGPSPLPSPSAAGERQYCRITI